MEFLLPSAVKKCIFTLENAGYEAFCVGGAVRDMIMGKDGPSDFDITTNCPPEKTISLFDKTIPTGMEHGTITVIIDDMPLEVTTYRTEGGYSDSRHPDKVLFVGNIEDDLSRRDFTVNAIAYNQKRGIFDPFNGCEDIKRRLLRTVGDPEKRFFEDALRIMRLYRFASKLDFSVEAATSDAAISLLHLLEKISRERIFAELSGMLCGKNIENAKGFFSFGALGFLGLPSCDISAVSSLPLDRETRFAALFIISGADSDEVLAALKSDTALRRDVKALLGIYSSAKFETDADIKRVLSEYGEEALRKYLPLHSLFKSENTEDIIARLDGIIKRNEPYKIADLEIGGEDIRSAGYEGREIGTVLARLQEFVIENPQKNNREILLKLITK